MILNVQALDYGSEGTMPEHCARARARLAVPGEDRVSRMRRTPLQNVVAGPSAEQDSEVQRLTGPADEE